MCIPRVDPATAVDPKCPFTNRPDPAANPPRLDRSGKSNKFSFDVVDATNMVPFIVGDYLTYSGVESNGQIVCYGIVANVGAFSESPGYILPEDIIIAPQTNDPNLEAGESRVSNLIFSYKSLVS